MNTVKALSLIGLFALAIPSAGCLVETGIDAPPPLDYGTLSIEYTMAGSTDPALCASYGVSDAELIVYTTRGAFVAETESECERFWVSVSLDPGIYNADVTLVDPGDRAMSITKPLYSLEVLRDAELVVDVDFPPDSMLY